MISLDFGSLTEVADQIRYALYHSLEQIFLSFIEPVLNMSATVSKIQIVE